MSDEVRNVGEMANNVFEFINALPAEALHSLYGAKTTDESKLLSTSSTPWACSAIFQSLQPLAKQYVMRLLCVEQPIPFSTLNSWVSTKHTQAHNEAIRRLKQLSLLVEPDSAVKENLSMRSNEPLVMLNPHFQRNLRRSIVHPDIVPWKDDPKFTLKPDKTCPTRERIEGEMHRKWQSVLHFLVGSDPDVTKVPYPPESVILFMQRAGLMVETRDGKSLVISDRGYEFMLKDIHAQAWMFVLTLLLGQPTTVCYELLIFLFMLSHCRVAEDYPLGALTNAQLGMAKDFINLGLLHQRKASSSRFYTTSVAVNLIFGATMSSTPENFRQSGLEIIVQTNYQVVAYTSSTLHISMLSLFSEIHLHLPKVIIGTITRDSVVQALSTGIKARQILQFLECHAHPIVSTNCPIVPENICDQIILWEREKERVEYNDDAGLMKFGDQISDDNFAALAAFAEKNGTLLWAGKTSERVLVVKQGGETPLLEYLRKIQQESR